MFTFSETWHPFISSCRGYTCSVEFTKIGQYMWTWLSSRYLLQDVTSYPLPVGCYTRVSNCCVNQDSSDGIVTRLQARRTGSWMPNKDKSSFPSPQRSDWLWDPLSLLCSGYWCSSGKQSDGRVKLSTYLHLAPRLTLRWLMSYIYIYIYIYGAPILDVSRSHTTTQHSR